MIDMKNLQAAASRYFRLYSKHCQAPDRDTLFNMLEAAHSLNDKLEKTASQDFYQLDEFIALKTLRNFFHHHVELKNEVTLVPVSEDMPIYSDLPLLCLVPTNLVTKAITIEKRKDNRLRVEQALRFYGEVADINPAIFNFSVHAFEKLDALLVTVEGKEWELFAKSYNLEERSGYSHFVTGNILCRAGDVIAVIESIYANNR